MQKLDFQLLLKNGDTEKHRTYTLHWMTLGWSQCKRPPLGTGPRCSS